VSLRVYELVTERMIAALEAGTVPWVRPWSAQAGRPVSLAGRPYRGVNVFTLALAASAHGYSSPCWGTYRQITGAGGQVRRGERSAPVVFWKLAEVSPRRRPGPDDDPAAGDGEDSMDPVTVTVPVLRYFPVFNACQADGLPAWFYRPA